MKTTSECSDLKMNLASDIYAEVGADHVSVMDGLDYLMRHGWIRRPDEAEAAMRDQVPGRTITQSEYRDTLNHAVKVSGYGDDWERGFCTGLTVGGARVAPDPEPTNAEKLEALLRETEAAPMSVTNRARWMDAQGVKAPGGDDE